MRTKLAIDLEKISFVTGRPVRSFSAVCLRSGFYNRRALKECAGMIKKHEGSVLIAVHPGFYLQDKDKGKIIAGIGTKDGKDEMNDRYEQYRKRFEDLLLKTRKPLFLFIEKHKGVEPYRSIFDFCRSDLTLVVETERESPVPVIGNCHDDGLVSWMRAAYAMTSGLGVKEALFTGEYLFIGQGRLSGCVKGAIFALSEHFSVSTNTEFTFPNTPKKLDSML